MNSKFEISKLLLERRPNLSINSVKTYTSFLNTIYNHLKQSDNEPILKVFDNDKEVLTYIHKIPNINRRKTILSALFVITGKIEYRRDMITDCNIVNDTYMKQEMTEKEKENWVSQRDIETKMHELLPTATQMLNKKIPVDYSFLNRFLLFSCMCGYYIPPRRSLDWSSMCIKHFDKKKDNYMTDKGVVVFQNYKTFKEYGRFEINLKDISPSLWELLKLWYKLNPTNHLFFGATFKGLTPTQVTKYNNAIWDGRLVSTNMYRHSFLTSFFSNKMPSLEDMENLSKFMAHSVMTALKYIKKDTPKEEEEQ